MKTEKEIETEKTAASEKPADTIRAAVESEPAPKSFLKKALPWLIVALVFFLGGMALIYFAVYQPAKLAAADAANTANDTITSLTNDLSAAKTQATEIQTSLDATKAELMTAQTDLATRTTELAKANQAKVLFKFQSDINAARAVLQALDVASAQQAIAYAKTDLTGLQATDVDPVMLTGFADRLAEAEANLNEPNLLKSKAALETIYTNLLQLVINLN